VCRKWNPFATHLARTTTARKRISGMSTSIRSWSTINYSAITRGAARTRRTAWTSTGSLGMWGQGPAARPSQTGLGPFNSVIIHGASTRSWSASCEFSEIWGHRSKHDHGRGRGNSSGSRRPEEHLSAAGHTRTIAKAEGHATEARQQRKTPSGASRGESKGSQPGHVLVSITASEGKATAHSPSTSWFFRSIGRAVYSRPAGAAYAPTSQVGALARRAGMRQGSRAPAHCPTANTLSAREWTAHASR